jgi:hypothetical protein
MAQTGLILARANIGGKELTEEGRNGDEDNGQESFDGSRADRASSRGG